MKKIILAAAVLGSALASPAMAQTVINGSFETPTVTTSPDYGNGGATVLNSGAGFEPNGGAFGYAAAPDGNQILHLQNGGSAILSLADLVTGRSYAVSFLAAARPGYGNLPVTVSYDGGDLGSFTPTSTAFTAFTGFRFTATGTTGGLGFTGGNGGGDLNTGIDLVSLSGVPEPATWALMIMGFGVIGGSMRRRSTLRTVGIA